MGAGDIPGVTVVETEPAEQAPEVDARPRRMTLNMGPQHPSTHGVLRLVLDLDGETIVASQPDIGYLHTGIEKEFEVKNYQQAVTLTDRIDYLAPLSNNLCYCLAVEKLLAIEIPPMAQWTRVMLTELTRLNSHLVWLGTHAIDIGAMSVFPRGWQKRVKSFIDVFPSRVDEYEELLTNNRIWIGRTKGVGRISIEDMLDLGVTGPMLRAAGLQWDMRKSEPYSSYEKFDFEVPTRTENDVYARYLVRIEEMRQSARIIRQALEGMPAGRWTADAPHVVLPEREKMKTEMEALIYHFKIVTEGFRVPAGEVYQTIESPRGEVGYYVVSDGTAKPYRVHVRGPSFGNLQAIPCMIQGTLIADVIASIGSMDFVLGDADR